MIRPMPSYLVEVLDNTGRRQEIREPLLDDLWSMVRITSIVVEQQRQATFFCPAMTNLSYVTLVIQT